VKIITIRGRYVNVDDFHLKIKHLKDNNKLLLKKIDDFCASVLEMIDKNSFSPFKS